ncbi:MAG: hypothetical protein IJ498_05700 [Akkermansia sp.]|nr:hypothetical protein [Akkermansia sp.]
MKDGLNEVLAMPVAILAVGLIWHFIIRPSTENRLLRFVLGLLLLVAGIVLMFIIRAA